MAVMLEPTNPKAGKLAGCVMTSTVPLRHLGGPHRTCARLPRSGKGEEGPALLCGGRAAPSMNKSADVGGTLDESAGWHAFFSAGEVKI